MLVATTVIEVGVDVPNATVMVILDADRFGMAQLHQLRGRVGRGAGLESHCFLVGAGATPEAEERLAAMVRTHDGFELAEIDLDIRGEGTIMGERQKGRNDLKLASLRRDREWVSKARRRVRARRRRPHPRPATGCCSGDRSLPRRRRDCLQKALPSDISLQRDGRVLERGWFLFPPAEARRHPPRPPSFPPSFPAAPRTLFSKPPPRFPWFPGPSVGFRARSSSQLRP